MKEILDFKKISENLSFPVRQLSETAKQIQSLSSYFKISVPTHFYDNIETIVNPKSDITYIPPASNRNLMEIRSEMASFSQKLENKIEEKFIEIGKTIDKKSNSSKIKLVNDKNAHCKFCGYLLMRVQHMLYFGSASMKCPKCGKIVQIPEQLNFKEL